MILNPLQPKRILDKAYLRQRPLHSDIKLFRQNLLALLGKVDEIEREENQKNHLRDFLRDTFYKSEYEINVSEDKDLVIRLGSDNKTPAGVIVEAKKPSNKAEMLSAEKPNAKALHELILYYFDERETKANAELKQLVITNIYQYYIFDANTFDKHIYRNVALKKLYKTYTTDKKDTKFFYEETAKIINKLEAEIPCAYFDIRDYEKLLHSDEAEDNRKLIALYKILSPQHLLKVPFANDSNALNDKFYRELLHIIGLEEHKEGSKTIIRRVEDGRQSGSLVEMAIAKIETKNRLSRITTPSTYGATKNEQLFGVALELCITWINRLLFLKLLEGQLVSYHNGNKQYRFLNSATLHDFDELFTLFHDVLAKPIAQRRQEIAPKYALVPYLNSSLFEISELESEAIDISALDNTQAVEIYTNGILKSEKKKTPELATLDYIFRFLDAYDFASEAGEDIQEDTGRSLINASVLGKVFEKINGYKDGSIYTPGFITMYMCRQAIRPAVVQKFNEAHNWQAEDYDHLKNLLAGRKKPAQILHDNQLINSLHICDPAVGSGHFLVSALNELIAIKADLGILADEKGQLLHGWDIEIANDELAVTDTNGEFFAYKMAGSKPAGKETQRLQQTLFYEKQTLIENCLFGVDINPNSVKICRLRLWIELLKNAYYKPDGGYAELETLPNIDINIKCGNSLLSRFALDADLKASFSKQKFNLQTYRLLVDTYHKTRNRDEKAELTQLIDEIKQQYTQTIYTTDPRRKKLSEIRGQLELAKNAYDLFGKKMDESKRKLEQRRLELLLEQKEKELDDAESGTLYRNAFEWRFEFPEVLNEEGDFVGFDIVVGNPPYGVNFSKKSGLPFENDYKTFNWRGESYTLFIERAYNILKLGGKFGYIIPDTILNLGFTEAARLFVLKNTVIEELVLLPANVFANATVDTILLFYKKIDTFTKNNIRVKIFDKRDIIDNLNFPSKYFEINSEIWLKQKTFNLQSNTDELLIIDRIDSDYPEINSFAEIFYGIKVYQVGKGSPPQTEEIRTNKPFTSVNMENQNWLPFFDGKHINRYHLLWNNNNWIFYGKWLAEPRTPEKFEGEKILIRKITSDRLIANYIPYTSYCNTLLFVLKLLPNEAKITYKSLLGVLNSFFIGWYFKKKFQISESDTFPQIMIRDILQFAVPNVQTKETKGIEILVDKILTAKKENPQADTTAWEKEIDQLVYQLYNLTAEEIAIVEGKA